MAGQRNPTVDGWVRQTGQGSRTSSAFSGSSRSLGAFSASNQSLTSNSNGPLEALHEEVWNWGQNLVHGVESSFSALGEMIAGGSQDSSDAMSSGTTPRMHAKDSARSHQSSGSEPGVKAAFTKQGSSFVGRTKSTQVDGQGNKDKEKSLKRTQSARPPTGLRVKSHKEQFESMLQQSKDSNAEKELCKRMFDMRWKQSDSDDAEANALGRLYSVKHKAYGQPKHHNKLNPEKKEHSSGCTCARCQLRHDQHFENMMKVKRQKEALDHLHRAESHK